MYLGAKEGRKKRGREKKKAESGAIATWSQLNKDAVSTVLYGGVCTGCFTVWFLQGSTKQDLLVLQFSKRQL